MTSSSASKPKRCPYMRGDPCMEHECAHWLQEAYNPDPHQPHIVEMRWDCVIIHHYRVARDTARFADQSGVALLDLRNAVQDEEARLSRGVGLALNAWRAEKALEDKA